MKSLEMNPRKPSIRWLKIFIAGEGFTVLLSAFEEHQLSTFLVIGGAFSSTKKLLVASGQYYCATF
jgi:hypothetical protein